MVRNRPATRPLRIAVAVRNSTAIPDPIDERLSRFRQASARITFFTRESGINRGGIDRLLGDMTMRRLDVLLLETVSALTRLTTSFLGLVAKAVEIGVRVIVTDIGLDTAKGNWRKKLIKL